MTPHYHDLSPFDIRFAMDKLSTTFDSCHSATALLVRRNLHISCVIVRVELFILGLAQTERY